MFVGIRLPKPPEPQSRTSRALGNVEELDIEAIQREAPPNSPNNATPVKSRSDPQEHNETTLISRPQQPQASDGTVLGTLREEHEFVIEYGTSVRSVESPALGVGDILELDELEDLRVNSGVLPLLVIVYEEKELVDGS